MPLRSLRTLWPPTLLNKRLLARRQLDTSPLGVWLAASILQLVWSFCCRCVTDNLLPLRLWQQLGISAGAATAYHRRRPRLRGGAIGPEAPKRCIAAPHTRADPMCAASVDRRRQARWGSKRSPWANKGRSPWASKERSHGQVRRGRHGQVRRGRHGQVRGGRHGQVRGGRHGQVRREEAVSNETTS